MKTLAEQVAIVTGGARGIGGASARKLAEHGAKVLIADYSPDAAEENATRIRDAGGVADVIETDVSRRDHIEAMVERAVSLWGRLDILVNNAWGSKERDTNAVDLPESAWDYGIDTMVKAHFLGVKYAVPHMQKGGRGSIVNISSVQGFMMSPEHLTYQTGKSAVIGLTRQMACDFGPMNIRVNAICPGHIVTERVQPKWDANPDLFRFFEEQYPLRRVGATDDIANAVRFLCSDEAAFITGHTLVVDGGLTIQLQEALSVRMAQYYRDHPEINLPE